MLLADTGKPVIAHTFETACQVRQADAVVIATDDEQIAAVARRYGARVAMTSPDCPSGADRVAETVRRLPAAELIVNLQGDEPDMDPRHVDRLFAMMEDDAEAGMATLATPIRSRATLEDPACVKVACDERGRALYFSRSPIPHAREWRDELLTADPPIFLHHLGIYAYRRELLLRMTSLPPSRLEQVERLEQLRVLEAGDCLLVGVVPAAARGIDTPADYAAFVARRLAA
jgi:3-deoxy-manno-octulosonate cytidylyltransferase (CMP-KDO synthetase)